MATTAIISGFAGVATINGTQVLVTNGNINRDCSQTFVTLMDVGKDTTHRTKILYAPGTCVFNGSINFDISQNILNSLLTMNALFQRGYSFSVALSAGNANFTGYTINNCYLTTLGLQGAAGGLLTANLSFISNNNGNELIQWNPSSQYISPSSVNNGNQPLAYWYSGSSNSNVLIKDWNFNFTQDVQPKYLNQVSSVNNKFAQYFRCGLNEATLDINLYKQLSESGDDADVTNEDNVIIATKTFTIMGTRKNFNYVFNGPTDIGTYSYSLTSANVAVIATANSLTPMVPNVNIVSIS